MEQFKAKNTFSNKKVNEFKEKIKNSNEINSREDFCIYTTGSFGRSEAGENSDLDLFFLFENEENKFPKITKTLIDADIILACREMEFPEFSGDGTYLEVHNVKNIYNELGSRNDDYFNFFTARMLLLLESKPLYNDEFYYLTLEKIIEKYYIDFHKNEKNFLPVFLINDVIRFWRTLCLNYEHNRNRKSEDKVSVEIAQKKRNEGHIKNLKLKFSRKLTCYSFLLSVLYSNEILSQEKVIEIIKQTPLERLEVLSKNNKHITDKIEEMFNLYNWFLEKTHVQKPILLEWISSKENRNEAFGKARDFAKIIFDLIIESEKKDKLLYFLI